jgi:hypothetical protein
VRLISPVVASALGVAVGVLDALVIPNVDTDRGEVLELDQALDAGSNMLIGHRDSGWVRARTPTLLGAYYGRVHGVALANLRSGQPGRVRIMGHVMFLFGGAATAASGIVLGKSATHGKRVKGIVLEAVASAGLGPVLWNGLLGFTTFWDPPSGSGSSGSGSVSSGGSFPSSPPSGGSGPPGSWGDSAPGSGAGGIVSQVEI